MGVADDLNAQLVSQGLTVAAAESLTGGMVCAALTSTAGASKTVRGAVVSYATDLKTTLLGVDEQLLQARGPVHPDVAREMARGIARVCDATFGVATTGVAGPDTQNGVPVGTVFIAVYDSRDDSDHQSGLQLSGTREQIRRGAAHQALELAARVVGRNA